MTKILNYLKKNFSLIGPYGTMSAFFPTMTSYRIVFFLFSIFLLSSCASSYKSVRPDMISYQNEIVHDSLVFSYQYDVMKLHDNRKYQRREDRKDVRVVAIKIKNISDTIININNINFYAGENRIAPMAPVAIHKKIKQKVWIYLLYSLISINRTETNCVGGRCTTTTKLVFPVGVFISLGNMILAGIANGNLKKELETYRLKDYSLKPGEKYYALIGFHSISHEPLSIKLRKMID